MKYLFSLVIFIFMFTSCKAQFLLQSNGFKNPATNEIVTIDVDYYYYKTKYGYKPNTVTVYGVIIDKIKVDSFTRDLVLNITTKKPEYHSFYYGLNRKFEKVTIEGFSNRIDKDFDHFDWLKITTNEEKVFVKN